MKCVLACGVCEDPDVASVAASRSMELPDDLSEKYPVEMRPVRIWMLIIGICHSQPELIPLIDSAAPQVNLLPLLTRGPVDWYPSSPWHFQGIYHVY